MKPGLLWSVVAFLLGTFFGTEYAHRKVCPESPAGKCDEPLTIHEQQRLKAEADKAREAQRQVHPSLLGPVMTSWTSETVPSNVKIVNFRRGEMWDLPKYDV